MAHPLDQLYKTKLQLLAVLLAVAGLALVVWGYWLKAQGPGTGVLSDIAVNLGFAFVTTALIASSFEYLDRKHGRQRTKQELREAVRDEAPAIRDAVLDSLAFNADALKGLASDEQLDRIASNALALRLGDDQLAHELYADLREQVLTAPERWHDVSVSVVLSPWPGGPATGKGSMFVATIRWEYRTMPTMGTMRFACVGDEQEHRELSRDPSVTSAWHFDSSGGLDPANREVFELVAFTVDGQERKIRRTTRRGMQIYSVGLQADDQEHEVTLAYTYNVLAQRDGNVVYLDLPRPAQDVRVQFDYSSANIRYVTVLDYFASSERSHVARAPESSEAKTINVSFDGWVLPRAGVAFVWVLDDEFSKPVKPSVLAK